jgi:hypothetical protein
MRAAAVGPAICGEARCMIAERPGDGLRHLTRAIPSRSSATTETGSRNDGWITVETDGWPGDPGDGARRSMAKLLEQLRA